VKLAVVVQRYGQGVHGSAELHARYIAEHLAHHAEIDVLTTCASDDVTWANQYNAGSENLNGVQVRRFRVSPPRDAHTVSRLAHRVFHETHSLADELTWLDARGPKSRSLMRHLRNHGDTYDFCLFFSYRYCHAYHGARAIPSRAILVPRAERDDTIGLRMFADVFRGVRAILYDSPEERTLIHAVAGNQQVPGVVVGAGADVPPNPQAGRFRQKHNIHGPFALYVGRIDERSGCAELFDVFRHYANESSSRLSLIIAGDGPLTVPKHPRIRHLGVLEDSDKFDALAAAEALVLPSPFESLSRAALEAWALGKPVLANAKSEALRGQCGRSNGGLFYHDAEEFAGMLKALDQNRWLSASLGKSGRQYFHDNYDWRVVERKYHEILVQLQKTPPRHAMNPLPGWRARHRRDLAPAADIVRSLS
jgi:glycosyltransferase involved in cell wall biosynthesis